MINFPRLKFLLFVIFLSACSVVAVCAQEKPSAVDIKDALSVKLPAYFTVGDLKIKGQAFDTNPGQIVFFLTQDWRPALAMGPDQPFMKTVFSVTVTADDDLFEVGQQAGNIIGLRQTFNKNRSIVLNGVAASAPHGNALVTSIVGFDQTLPPGAPRSNFPTSAVVMGTPQWDQARAQMATSKEANLVAVRGMLSGVWKGDYVCGQGMSATTITISEIEDDGSIKGTDAFGPKPGIQYNFNFLPGVFAILGTYQKATRGVTFRAVGWINRPKPDYQWSGWTATLSADSRKMLGQMDPRGVCKGGQISMQNQ